MRERERMKEIKRGEECRKGGDTDRDASEFN